MRPGDVILKINGQAITSVAEASRALNAIREDETAARAMGINTFRHLLGTYLLSAFFFGVGGGLLAHLESSVGRPLDLHRRLVPGHIHGLPPGLALVVFDAAVNMGVPTAVRMLQTVLRGVTVDGVMGPETVASAKQYLPRIELIAQYLRLRNSWYRDLAAKSEKHAKYLYGWEMRCWRLALEAGLWRSV